MQFGHHRSQQHCGAQRLQRVFWPHQQGRRRTPACALQRGEHFRDFGAARIQRIADLLLVGVERTQPRFGIVDLAFDIADLSGDIDQLLIELAAILPDRGNIGLQFLLLLRRAFLLLARGLEFLLAFLDVRIGRRHRLRRRSRNLTRYRRKERAGKSCRQEEDDRKWNS